MTRSTRIALLAALALGATGAAATAVSLPASAQANARPAVHVPAPITPEQARAAALRAYPGSTAKPASQSVERATKNGRAAFEVEIVLNGREMDVYVDAETGAVLSAGSEEDEAGEMDEQDEAGEMDKEDGEEDGAMAATDVPGVVAAALRRTHASATDVTWDRENAGFEASFTEGSDDVSVVFAVDGAVRETETAISIDAVPEAVQRALAHDYAGASVNEFARIVSADGTTTYEAEITRDGRTMDVVFDASGRVVSTEQD